MRRRRRATPAHAAANALLILIKWRSHKSFNSLGPMSSKKMEVVKHRVLSGSKVMTGDEHQYCKRKGVPRGTDDQHCPSRMGKIVQVGSNEYNKSQIMLEASAVFIYFTVIVRDIYSLDLLDVGTTVTVCSSEVNGLGGCASTLINSDDCRSFTGAIWTRRRVHILRRASGSILEDVMHVPNIDMGREALFVATTFVVVSPGDGKCRKEMNPGRAGSAHFLRF
ncbi:hypothetical protein C8J57DRAFT_1667772 [Mycena rebaudengoi]|nr:hypothetical protein C8J57DRAFT_1667772 [Mycena rebaudengoi]